jgi:hypothetical protein
MQVSHCMCVTRLPARLGLRPHVVHQDSGHTGELGLWKRALRHQHIRVQQSRRRHWHLRVRTAGRRVCLFLNHCALSLSYSLLWLLCSILIFQPRHRLSLHSNSLNTIFKLMEYCVTSPKMCAVPWKAVVCISTLDYFTKMSAKWLDKFTVQPTIIVISFQYCQQLSW